MIDMNNITYLDLARVNEEIKTIERSLLMSIEKSEIMEKKFD